MIVLWRQQPLDCQQCRWSIAMLGAGAGAEDDDDGDDAAMMMVGMPMSSSIMLIIGMVPQ
ncbi:hypothetical protein [Bradyrhizobium sp. WSM3983]|uniref:hypothetical protein n=1 Tax=Bradyrhizobium sp. WSM3983 TaxID=1038867 RepID=UPI0004811D43|nr:hypothetical protein [Bradyrhizobium sp. WSM3983]